MSTAINLNLVQSDNASNSIYKSYQKYGMCVTAYSPNIETAQRTKTDIQIKDKIISILERSSCK